MLIFHIHKNGIIVPIETIFISFIRYRANIKIIQRYSMKTAANLSYKIYGEAAANGADDAPVILLHSILGRKRHWDSIGKTMFNLTKRAVLSVDLRNHGDSPQMNSHKYEDMVADILKLLDKLDIDKAHLIGHSMGGRASMSVSLLAPEKVATLLVVDISPVSTSKHLMVVFPKIMAAMKNVNFKKYKTVKESRLYAARVLQDVIDNEIIMKDVISNVQMKSDGTIGWACNLDILIRHFKYISSFPDNLRKKIFYGPTLFIGGQQSEYIPPDDLVSIREMFPSAVITYVPQIGHSVYVEDPKTFLELAIGFIKNYK